MHPNQKHLSKTAGRWARFVRACGCHLDAERKAAESLTFCLRRRASSFAVPSKLEGVSRHQKLLAHLKHEEGWVHLDLHFDQGRGRVLALWHGTLVGHARPKHVAWLLPLLATGALRCYVLQVTGDHTQGKTLGCNVTFAGIAAALDAHAQPAPLLVPLYGYPDVAIPIAA